MERTGIIASILEDPGNMVRITLHCCSVCVSLALREMSSTERDVYHSEGSLPPLEMSVRDTFHCEKCLALGALCLERCLAG